MSQRTDRAATSAIVQRTWPPGDAGPIHTDGGRSKTPSAIYRELRVKGFGPDEAGNLVAYLNGVHPVESGWTPREIERPLFLRHLVERGRGDAHAAS